MITNDDSSNQRNFKGSASRDIFKWAHKQFLPSNQYACDLDFVLVSKYPPGIAAFLDFKKPNDYITFSEVLAYNALIKIAPLYIVKAVNPEIGPFEIFQYQGGDWRPEPPVVELVNEFYCKDWAEFAQWEARLRSGKGRE